MIAHTNKKMNIMIDIDGTVSEDIPNEKSNLFILADPLPNAVESVNELYRDSNNTITFFTSRTEKHRDVTKKWLKKYGFKYHQLLMNKPRGGNYVWIDNLSVTGVKYNSSRNDWKNIMGVVEHHKKDKFSFNTMFDNDDRNRETNEHPMSRPMYIHFLEQLNQIPQKGEYDEYVKNWNEQKLHASERWENLENNKNSDKEEN